MHSHENDNTCIPKSTKCARRSDWYSDQRLKDSSFRPFLQRYEIHRSKWWGKTENASPCNLSKTVVSQQQVQSVACFFPHSSAAQLTIKFFEKFWSNSDHDAKKIARLVCVIAWCYCQYPVGHMLPSFDITFGILLLRTRLSCISTKTLSASAKIPEQV